MRVTCEFEPEGAGPLLRAASLMDSGDFIQALGVLNATAMQQSRAVVGRVSAALGASELVIHDSLLPCPKILARAAIKASILSCFALQKNELIKSLAAMYCALSHFQDIARLGVLAFSTVPEITDASPGGRKAALARAQGCLDALTRVHQELDASSREMMAFMDRLDGFCQGVAAGKNSGIQTLQQGMVHIGLQ